MWSQFLMHSIDVSGDVTLVPLGPVITPRVRTWIPLTLLMDHVDVFV